MFEDTKWVIRSVNQRKSDITIVKGKKRKKDKQ